MSTRLLLCVEPDTAALAVITSTLEPYGFIIRNITNGDMAVDFARKERPSLMMVSVEPKKIGYAICNKIKRNDELKEIPLILTSSDETLEKLEQHKTFKLRANDYMRKPLDQHQLLRKLKVLIGLEDIEPTNSRASASEEIFVDSDSISSEISIDADDIVEEPTSSPSLAPLPGRNAGLFSPDEPLDVPPSPKSLEEHSSQKWGLPAPTAADEEDDLFSEGRPTRVGPAELDQEETLPPEMRGDTVSASMPDDHTGQTPLFDLPEELGGVVKEVASSDAPQAFPAEPATVEGPTIGRFLSTIDDIEGDPDLLRKAHLDVPPGPDEVNITAVPLAVNAANDSALIELQGRYHELEDDKRRLATEVEELRQRLQTLPFHKEKDLLSLRETINRKERDILELRDVLDARDRQLLDQRDVLREHERTRSDLEEKLVAFEKNVIYANERATTLAHDKEMAIERERGFKVRLEAVVGELANERDEMDALRKRLGVTEERCRLDVDKVRQELEDRIAEIETSHRDEVARLKDDRESDKAAKETEFRADLERISSSHQMELESTHKRYNEEKASLSDMHTAEHSKLRREHEKSLAALRDELVTVNETQKQTHLAAVELKEREHKLELSELRRAKESELLVAEDRRRREVEAIELRRTSDLDAAETRRRTELQAREEQHHANIADLERRHLAMKNDAMERQRIELDQVLSRATMMEAELAARAEDLAEMRRRVQRTEAESDTIRSDLRDREGKLSQMRDRIAELESKVADLEDQVLRSYRKIRDDDKSMDKAKRALGVAMTLLDERSAPALASRTSDEGQG